MAIAEAKASAADSEMAADPDFEGAEVVAATSGLPPPAEIAGNDCPDAESTSLPSEDFVLTTTLNVAA